MKYIILLNRKFPFLSGEPFIENEINVYIDKIDKFLILPSNIRNLDKKTRETHEKVINLVYEDKSLKYRQINNMLKSIKYIFLNKKIDTYERLKIKNSFIKKIYWGYFEESAKEQYNKISKVLEQFKFDSNDEIIIYSYWLYINAKVAVLLSDELKKRGIKVKTISRAHRFDIYEEEAKLKYLPQREVILAKLDKIYACSENGAEYLKNNYSNYKEKIDVSRLGTHDQGIGKHNFINKLCIVSCSRMTSVKRIDKIIEALKEFKNSDKIIEWTHLGGGPLEEELKERAKKELNFIKVNITGMIDNSEVYEYYKNNPVDIFINVSSSEGLPVSIMEAISFGIPVIATDVGGTKEIVINNKSGYLIKNNFENETLVKHIKDICNMEYDEYIALRRRTREVWEKNYQAENNYREFFNKINNDIKWRS